MLDRLLVVAKGVSGSPETPVCGRLGRAELENAPKLPIRLFVVAEGQIEFGEVQPGRDVLGPQLERALGRPPLELDLSDNPIDVSQVEGPADVDGIQPLGIQEGDLPGVVQVVGDVVGAEGSVSLGEDHVRG